LAELVNDLKVGRFLPHRRCGVSTVFRAGSGRSTTLCGVTGPALSWLQHSGASTNVTLRLVSTYASCPRARRS